MHVFLFVLQAEETRKVVLFMEENDHFINSHDEVKKTQVSVPHSLHFNTSIQLPTSSRRLVFCWEFSDCGPNENKGVLLRPFK